MRLAFANHDIKLLSWPTLDAAEKALSELSGSIQNFKVTKETAREFYSLESRPMARRAGLHRRAILIQSARTGIEPQLLPHPSSDLLYLGIDRSLLIIDVRTGLVRQHNLDSAFYWMSIVGQSNEIILVHEIGLEYLAPTGEMLWKYDTDIISQVELHAGYVLQVTYMGGNGIALDIRSGKPRS